MKNFQIKNLVPSRGWVNSLSPNKPKTKPAPAFSKKLQLFISKNISHFKKIGRTPKKLKPI
jgi:hypothetical protein